MSTTSTAGDDTFRGTPTTLNGADVLNGGAGVDTLYLTDSTSTSSWTAPSALVSGIENVVVRNLAGTSAVPAQLETATVTFSALAAGATVTINGVTVTGAANTGSTAADVTAAFLAGAFTNYTAAAVSGSTTSLTLTSTTTGNVTDLTATGTGTLPSISIVQGANAVAANNITNTVAAANFVDAVSFKSDVSTGAVTFTGLATGQTVTMAGNTAVTTNNLSASWSSATAPVVNVVGGTTAGDLTITSPAASKVTINSNGAPLGSTGLPGSNVLGAVSNTGTITSELAVNADSNLYMTSLTTSAKTITVTGGATLVAFTGSTTPTQITGANLTTVDASAMTTGGVRIVLSSTIEKFTGGTGADTVYTNGTLSAAAVIDAGAGTDTLIIQTATDLDTATEAAQYRNFETVRTAAGSFDASLLPGTTSIQFTGGTAAALTNMTAAQAASVQVRTNATTNTFALADSNGTSDVLSLSLGTAASATTGAVDITTGIVANGFETINLRAVSGSATTAGNATSTVAAFTADSATKITLTGSAFDLSNIATTKAVAIDGSALTGDRQATPVGLTVAGNAVAGSTVTGSAVRDVFTLGTVGSSYSTGAGDDQISSTVANLLSAAVYNKVDGGAGIDTLVITDGTTNNVALVDNTLKEVTNVERISITTTSGSQSVVTGGFFATNFAAGARFDLTSTTGNITLDTSTSNAAMTVVATTAGTAGTEGIATITTGGGADVISVTNAVAGGGAVIVSGAGNDTVSGGLDADAITGGTGVDVLTGGGGVDTFSFAAGDSSTTSPDTITDFAATDLIDLASAVSIVTYTSSGAGVATISAGGVATFNSADTTLAQRIVAVEAAINNGGTATAGQTAAFQYLGDAYVFVSDGVDGVGANDLLIKLAGLDLSQAANDAISITSAANGIFTFA